MSNEDYIETRINPYLEAYKKATHKKQKQHFGYVLVMLILLVSALAIFLLGYFIPLLYNATLSISVILIAIALLFCVLDYIGCYHFNKNKKSMNELEKQKFLYLTASVKNDHFVTICEDLIHKGENA